MTTKHEDLTFEDIFKDLIEESKNITIEYDHNVFHHKDNSFIDFKIISVNGCNTTYQFKKKIQALIRLSLKKLTSYIQIIDQDERIDYLDYIKDDLNELGYIVDTYTQVFEETEYGPREEHKFKSFMNPKFNGTKDDSISYYEKSIKRKAEEYAEVWLEVIAEAKYKVDFIINQIDLMPNNNNEDGSYVDLSRIEELSKIQSRDFDLTRLIQQCRELNYASHKGNSYSVIMLVRSIIDHVPPIFNKNNFQEVSGSYGAKSFKDSMVRLDKSSRKIADSALHQQVRQKETLPNRTQVNFSNDLDVLLAEVVRILK